MTHDRRSFLAAAAAPLLLPARTWAEPPQGPGLRATDGDESHEPNWSQRLTITGAL